MKLVVISYKECWPDPSSPSGYATVGGFPYQMKALSTLFSSTRLVLPEYQPPLPAGAMPLTGHHLSVKALPAPVGSNFRRKLALLTWLPRNIITIWKEIRQADAVHAPVPGDIGLFGLLIALMQRKRLFVRHCGTWGDTSTTANRFIAWLLPRIANQRSVVLATGGSDNPPEPKNLNVQWIFSTTLTQSELESLPAPQPWTPDQALRLVTVGRLTTGKNVRTIIEALPAIRAQHPDVHLDVVGDGPEKTNLIQLAERHHVGDHVTFHGNVDRGRVLDILQKAHLFVFPTRVAEGFPKAVLEALACGRPVIAPPVSVIPHLLKDDVGIILESTDAESVAQAVIDMTTDVDRLNAMMRQAQAISKQYTLEQWSTRIGQYLEAAWGSLESPHI